MSFLKISNLTLRYPNQSKPAIEQVNLSIDKNTVNILIGPNGSGKTTLFAAILGLNTPQQGEILLDGKPINHAKYQIGYLPQRFEFDQHIPLTVRELVLLALSTCNHTEQEKQTMIEEALSKVNAEKFSDELIRDLSGGQLQRVLLARAIVHQPKLLLLDEPEAGVDPGGERVFYQLINELVTKKQVTALIASHEISLVREYADQVICINKTVICSGDPDSTLIKKNLSKLYQEDVQLVHHHH